MAEGKPKNFFVDIVSFFGLLLPGSLLTLLIAFHLTYTSLAHDSLVSTLSHNWSHLREPVQWGLFFLSAYALGHILTAVTYPLPDACFRPWYWLTKNVFGGSPLLRVSDLKDVHGLARKLGRADESDPTSMRLKKNFSESLKRQLREYCRAGGSLIHSLPQNLADEINKALQDPAFLQWKDQDTAKLPSGIGKMLQEGSDLRGKKLLDHNRSILEYVYPGEIAERRRLPLGVVNRQIELLKMRAVASAHRRLEEDYQPGDDIYLWADLAVHVQSTAAAGLLDETEAELRFFRNLIPVIIYATYLAADFGFHASHPPAVPFHPRVYLGPGLTLLFLMTWRMVQLKSRRIYRTYAVFIALGRLPGAAAKTRDSAEEE